MKIRTATLLTAITLLALGGCQEMSEPEPIADPAAAPTAPAEPEAEESAAVETEPAPTEPEEPDADSDESTESSGDTDQ